MNLQKRKYEFFVTRQTYDNKLLKTRFIKEVNYLNRLNELSEIAEHLIKEKSVVDVFYQEYENEEVSRKQLSNYAKSIDKKLSDSELEYGLQSILNKRNERKTVHLNSDEMDIDELFNIARELNRYAEEKEMGVTIIATNPY